MSQREQDHIDDASERQVSWRNKSQRFWDAIQRHLRRPSDDDYVPSLQYLREKDPIENAETSPAEDERVDLQCIWAVEFYTPAYVDQLLKCLRQLSWDQEDFPGRESPAEWVRLSRLFSEGGSWLNLGTIRSGEDKRPGPSRDRTAPMPMHVRYAHGGLYSLTPSLTCIVICFVFEENFRCRLNAAVQRSRQTFTRPVSRGYQIFNPTVQKREEVRRVRHKCAKLAANWFRDNLPGVFSSGLIEGQLPTCELLTLQKAEPFPSLESGDPAPRYLQILELNSSFSAWKSLDVLGLKFSFRMLRGNLEYHSIFVVRESALDGDLLQAYGGSPGLRNYVDLNYQEMISRLAVGALLDGYNRRLNSLRDTITTRIRKSSRQRPFGTLQTLVDNVAYDVDIAAITTDLIASTDESSLFRRHTPPFVRCWDPPGYQDSLADTFCFTINRQAIHLQQADRTLRDHLTQYGSLLAATEDVRTQKWVLRLTFCVVVLTIVTLITGGVVADLITWVQGIWKDLRS